MKVKTTLGLSTTVISLTKQDIIDMLVFKGIINKGDILNESVIVNVPGGGDWSNMNLDIDEDCPIIVTYQENVNC